MEKEKLDVFSLFGGSKPSEDTKEPAVTPEIEANQDDSMRDWLSVDNDALFQDW